MKKTTKNTFRENMFLAEELLEDSINKDIKFLTKCKENIKNTDGDEQDNWQRVHDIISSSLQSSKDDLIKFKELNKRQ